jgi:hypothetical protein
MQRRMAFAAYLVAALTGVGAFAACPPDPPNPKVHPAKKRPATGCVDLNTLPQISEQIVARERAAPVAKPAYAPPEPRKYEGPTLGLTKPEPGVMPTPTVGYHWVLQ